MSLVNPIQGIASYPWFWLGTWSLSGIKYGFSDLRESYKLLELAFQSGVRHFDTAHFYGEGVAEKLLGRVFQSCRREIFISSKSGLFWQKNKVFYDGSEKKLRESVFRSLDNLQTDYLDLFQLHWPDPKIPLMTSIRCLQSLQKEGLIRFWGICNLNFLQLQEIQSLNIAPFFHQLHLNPIHRVSESFLAFKEIFHCAYSPFDQGLLTNNSYKHLGKKDVRNRNKHFSDNNSLAKVDQLKLICKQKHISITSYVILWLLFYKRVNAVLTGPRTCVQFLELMDHILYMRRFGLQTNKPCDDFNTSYLFNTI